MNKRIIAIGLAGVFAACGGKKEEDKPKGESTDKPKKEPTHKEPPVAEKAPDAEPAVAINPEVKQLIADLAANCTIDADNVRAESCKNGEDQKIFPYVQEKQPADYYVSVAEIALTDGAKDKNVLGAALVAIANAGWGTGKDWVAKNATPAAGQRFVSLVGVLTDAQGFSLGQMVAAIPLMAGMEADLSAALKKSPAKSLRNSVLNYYVMFGGTAVLPALDAIAKDTAEDVEARAAAVWAPGVALATPFNSGAASFAIADADKPQLCDMAKAYVADPTPRVAGSAAATLGRCKGTYIDEALAALEKRAETEAVDEGLTGAIKNQCWAESSVDPVNGTLEQCTRALAILEKIVSRTDLQPAQIQTSLWAISTVAKYGCGPGYGSGPGLSPECVAHAKELIGKFASNADPGLAAEAKRMADEL